jgi:DNA-binding CsgD family transcriptional regulator
VRSSKPQLRLSDVRRIFRLLAEVRRRGDDPAVWRPFMARGLLKRFRAELVISSEIYLSPTDEQGVWDVVDIGWSVDGAGNDWRIETRSRETNPQAYDLVVRDDAQPADGRAPILPRRSMYGGSAFILSHMPLPHINAIDQLGLHRAHGEPCFTGADHRLLRLLHVELGRFWRRDVLERTRDAHRTLAPRMKQTLALLVDGKSEKEIAFAVGISPHTVHNYVKALHQRFGVSSRGELLAAASKREKDFVPRLSVQVLPAASTKRAAAGNRVTSKRG